jgi:hypothetical protein
MKTFNLLPIAALVLGAFALPVLAQSGNNGNNRNAPSAASIDQRQADQQQSIAKGVAAGWITAAEAERLQSGQQNVQRMEDRANADGRLSRTERTEISQEQTRQERRISRAVNNGEFVHGMDQRKAEQRAQIDKGVAAGWLTAQEADRLNQGQFRIGRMETRAKADGTITVAESDRIRLEQDRQGKAITAATTNR